MVLAVVIQGTLTTLRQSCQQPVWDRPVSRRSRLISVPVVAVFRAIPGSRTVPFHASNVQRQGATWADPERLFFCGARGVRNRPRDGTGRIMGAEYEVREATA